VEDEGEDGEGDGEGEGGRHDRQGGPPPLYPT